MARPGRPFALHTHRAQVDRAHKTWRKNAALLYDFAMIQSLECPSLTVQWMPDRAAVDAGCEQHRLLIGTYSSSVAEERGRRAAAPAQRAPAGPSGAPLRFDQFRETGQMFPRNRQRAGASPLRTPGAAAQEAARLSDGGCRAPPAGDVAGRRGRRRGGRGGERGAGYLAPSADVPQFRETGQT